ncbi:hypothetical protein JXC34_00085 [Candidatus Woesearchaeota archaeon]|nr:hypothetical protein [Candidatus Woesearchaeota archaeon]
MKFKKFKFDMDKEKFESLLALLLLILIGLEVLLFLYQIFPIPINLISNIFVYVNFLKVFLYKIVLILGGLFLMAWLIEFRSKRH